MGGDNAERAATPSSSVDTVNERPLRCLLAVRGSHGDVLPYLGLGRELRRRGHDVYLLANGRYAEDASKLGIESVPLGTAADWNAMASHPDQWHPKRGLQRVAEVQARWFVRPAFDAITRLFEPGRTVVAAQSLVFGALIAREMLGIPTAMLHLSPFVLRSLDLPPVRPDGTRWPRLPRPLAAAAAWAFDHLLLDRHFGPATFALRQELGLPKRRRLFHRWMFEADANIAWWPEWFAPLQHDWPDALEFVGFPFFDGVAAERERECTGAAPALDPNLEAWLSEGSPPVVVTPGSANPHGEALIASAIAATNELGRRLLILTTFALALPGQHSAHVRLEPYAPLSALLPRCAAIAHHGGLGTAARALQSGTPQVIVPAAFDNPDNAWWLGRLGVIETLPANKLTEATMRDALERALQRCPEPNPDLNEVEAAATFAAVADRIESLAR